MAPLNPEPFGGGYNPRPYRPDLYPPQPVTKRHVVTTKDDTYIDENGVEVRVPVEQRPPKRTKRVTRVTTFGIEEIEVDDRTRGDQTR